MKSLQLFTINMCSILKTILILLKIKEILQHCYNDNRKFERTILNYLSCNRFYSSTIYILNSYRFEFLIVGVLSQ